jgi:tetratricopeptide (TPR) repeat protein
MDKHPDPALLSSFARGRLSRRRNRDIVRHLLAYCAECCRTAAQFLPPLRTGAAAGLRRFDYGKAFSEAWQETERRQSQLTAEQAVAPELLRELLAQPFDRQWILATTSPRYRSWAFCDLLLDAAREWGFQDPSRAVELSRLGVEIATRLDPAAYGKTRVYDLEARAWAGLGNAQRIRADLRSAEESFGTAERLLKKGTGDPLEMARILLLKSSLRGHQQRFREAFRLLDRAAAIGRRLGDSHLCGRILILRGFLLGISNDPEAAIPCLTEGISTVGPSAEPRLLVSARHNLVLFLFECGRSDEAVQLLEPLRPLHHQVGDRMSLLRLRWLEGKIAVSRHEYRQAEEILRDVRRELIERELDFEVALLSLDLAQLYAFQGRSAELRRLTEEMLPIFKSRNIHREAIAALLLFGKAAEMEQVTLGLIREVSSYLKDCHAGSGLRSREPR